MQAPIKHSDALYYPYINIRNMDWLKATLLIFPHVLRMMPRNEYYQPSIDPLFDELCSTIGSRGQPLVGIYDLESQAIGAAAKQFCGRITDDLQYNQSRLEARFSRESAKDFGRGDDSKYQIHKGNFTIELTELLQSRALVWRPDATYGARGEWFAMHPLLGESLMSCFALAAAKDAGCEIVTDDPNLHHVVSEMGDDETFSHVRDRYQHTTRPSADTTVAQIVISNLFDIRSLSLRNLISMAKEEDALYSFRAEIAKVVQAIPEMEDQRRLEAYLKDAADNIIEKWLQSRGSMSQFTRKLFGFGAVESSERGMADLAKSLATPTLTGLAATSGHAQPQIQVLAATAGLTVGVAYYATRQVVDYRKIVKSSPLRYLSLISESGSAVSLAKILPIRRFRR